MKEDMREKMVVPGILSTHKAWGELAQRAVQAMWNGSDLDGVCALTVYNLCVNQAGQLEAERYKQEKTQRSNHS